MISIEINTTTPNPKIITRSETEGKVIPKESRMVGIWIKAAVSTICDRIEIVSHLCGGALNMLYLIERKLKAIMSSMMIKRKNISVLAWVMSVSSWKKR